jgi:hypothetical protein
MNTQLESRFMEKDSKTFVDTNEWGYAEFAYDAASDTFAPTHGRSQANSVLRGADKKKARPARNAPGLLGSLLASDDAAGGMGIRSLALV